MTHLDTTTDHAKWEAVILSPQFANSLDRYFTDRNDFQSTVLINQIRTADLIPTDITLITQTTPIAALNLMHVHWCIKTLTFSLMNCEKMNQACSFAIAQLDDMPELIPESPQMRFVWTNYGLGQAPRLARIISPAATTPPCSPSLKYVDEGVDPIFPIREPMTSSKSPSPIPYLQKEKYRAMTPDSPTTSYFTIPPPIHTFENLKLEEQGIKYDDLSPAVSTPDERLFSEPPMSNPAFRNIMCRLCKTLGHKQANCSQYFCCLCRIKKPVHLLCYCPLKGHISFNSACGHLPHLPFKFLTNTGINNPNFFLGLDEWEKEDDKCAKTVAKLIKDQTREGVEPKLADWIWDFNRYSRGNVTNLLWHSIMFYFLTLFVLASRLPFSIVLVHVHWLSCTYK